MSADVFSMALGYFLCNGALCLGAGTERNTVLKVGAIFAANGAFSTNQSELKVQEREANKVRASNLIKGVTLGAIARIAGCSHKAAALTAVIFSVGSLVCSYINFRIDELKQDSLGSLSEIQLKLVKRLLNFANLGATHFAIGRALKPLIV